MIELRTDVATFEQSELALNALRLQRSRLSVLFRQLGDDDWSAPTRCSAWSVLDVVQHLRDVTAEWLSVLRGGSLPEGFDPRTTPAEWIARPTRRAVPETVDAFEQATAELLDEVRHLYESGATQLMPMPYGSVPWSVVVLHVVWDAWIHERDIVLGLGRRHDSAEIETRAAALFGLFMSAVPSRLVGAALDEAVLLDGRGGGLFRVVVNDDLVSVALIDGTIDGALRGVLGDVIDSLVGRSPDLSEVLHGPEHRVRSLGAFGRFMAAPAG